MKKNAEFEIVHLRSERRKALTLIKSLVAVAVTLALSGCLDGEHEHAAAEEELEFGDEYWASLAESYPELVLFPAAAVALEDRIIQGEWDTQIDWPIVATGAANMPDGTIMAWASWKEDEFRNVNPVVEDPDRENTHAVIYNPADVANPFGAESHSTHDMFCAGASMLEDGRVFIAGGGDHVSSTSIFGNGDFSEIDSLNQTRWYPTSTTLSSGQVVTALGNTQSAYPEIWTDGQGWDLMENVNLDSLLDEKDATGNPLFYRDWFPALNVAPDGTLFHPGPLAQLLSADLNDNHDTAVHHHGGLDDADPRLYNTTVMYDIGKMLVAGGGYGQNVPGTQVLDFSLTTATAFTVDINGEEPVMTPTNSMESKRSMQNSVVLPNGEVLVVGGTTEGIQFHDRNSVFYPEMWNPDTGEWRILAPHATPRNYHSIAILLKDARVLSAGGGLCGTCPTNHQNGQIYTPPYLYNAAGGLIARPAITGGGSEGFPGDSIVIQGSDDITEFNMVRLVAITHHHTTDQRFIPTDFVKTAAGQYRLDLNQNPNVLVPGYYWVFGLNANGTPSIGHTVQVKVTAENEPPAAALPVSKIAYEYYETTLTETKKLPNFEALTPVKTGYIEEFSLSEKQRNDNFAYRFHTKLIVTNEGEHTFYLASNDGSKLLINGLVVADADEVRSFRKTAVMGTVYLGVGEHDLQLQYFDADGGEALLLSWETPTTPKRPIQSEHLSEVAAVAPPISGTPEMVSYSYYEEDEWVGLPDFSSLIAVETGVAEGFDTSVRNRDENYGIRFSAVLDVPAGGHYTFYLTSNGGSSLVLNNRRLINNDGLDPEKSNQGSVMLLAGKHLLEVEFFAGDAGESIVVEWNGPEFARQEIPLERLAASLGGGASAGGEGGGVNTDGGAEVEGATGNAGFVTAGGGSVGIVLMSLLLLGVIMTLMRIEPAVLQYASLRKRLIS